MHKLQGVLEPQSYRSRWKEQNAAQRMPGFNFVCTGIVLGAVILAENGNLHGWGREMLTEECAALASGIVYFFPN